MQLTVEHNNARRRNQLAQLSCSRYLDATGHVVAVVLVSGLCCLLSVVGTVVGG